MYGRTTHCTCFHTCGGQRYQTCDCAAACHTNYCARARTHTPPSFVHVRDASRDVQKIKLHVARRRRGCAPRCCGGSSCCSSIISAADGNLVALSVLALSIQAKTSTAPPISTTKKKSPDVMSPCSHQHAHPPPSAAPLCAHCDPLYTNTITTVVAYHFSALDPGNSLIRSH